MGVCLTVPAGVRCVQLRERTHEAEMRQRELKKLEAAHTDLTHKFTKLSTSKSEGKALHTVLYHGRPHGGRQWLGLCLMRQALVITGLTTVSAMDDSDE